MPLAGTAFIVGGAAICGLPPFNGFVSEALVAMSAFEGLASGGGAGLLLLLGAIGGLALISGLAVAVFTKATGIAFLGLPRSAEASHAHEGGLGMTVPLLGLAALCVVLGLAAPLLLRLVAPPVQFIAGGGLAPVQETWETASNRYALAATGLTALAGLLAILRVRLLRARAVSTGPTWDCGYDAPTARMQYTGSSFVQPLQAVFGVVARRVQVLRPPMGYFPTHASYRSETPDLVNERVYRPAVAIVALTSSLLHRFQHGRLHLYLLYILGTLVVLLAWKVRF
jgi:NADH:ubiquinone oxidoreductase subunit 5 (subunit L)/multisubunit Na+/H+ antiporter MnhA subunit